MKKAILITVLALMAGFGLRAQNVEETLEDETVLQADSLLVNKTIYEVMPSNVSLNQSVEIGSALASQIASNGRRQFSGYRVRLYVGSSQSARSQSARIFDSFKKLYPDIPAYRIFSSPNFRVVAGNFRTRLEAENFARAIKSSFPAASVMRDKFKYPAIGRVNTVAVDTTTVAVPLIGE